MISVEELHQLLDYDPVDGRLFWKARTPEMFPPGKRSAVHRCRNFNSEFAGCEAGILSSSGYRVIRIWGVLYSVHRVIWAMHTSAWPVGEIDHEEHDRSDNRFSKMRDVSRAENKKNISIRKNNTSGFTGVVWNEATQNWRAHIFVKKKLIYLGLFHSKTAAAEARATAEVLYGFHPNHGRNTSS